MEGLIKLHKDLNEGFYLSGFKPIKATYLKGEFIGVPEGLSGYDDMLHIFSYVVGASSNDEKGKSIPGELEIVGCDGLRISDCLIPKLATIKIDFRNFAREVLNRIIPAILDHPGPYPQKLLLETELIRGESINREG